MDSTQFIGLLLAAIILASFVIIILYFGGIIGNNDGIYMSYIRQRVETSNNEDENV